MSNIRNLSENSICHLTVGGYLFKDNKVLLIYHPKINKWLPVGGHIDENETPEMSIIKEFKEEVGLNIKVVNSGLTMSISEPNIRRVQPSPFYSEIHSVGDHNHHCQFFICELIDVNQNVNVDGIEVKEFEWLSKEEVQEKRNIGDDIKNLALIAFELSANVNRD